MNICGARDGAVGWGTALQAGRSRVRFPMVSLEFDNPSGLTVGVWSTQPLTEMSTSNIFWGKGGRWVGIATFPLSCTDFLEMWEPHPTGTLSSCPGL